MLAARLRAAIDPMGDRASSERMISRDSLAVATESQIVIVCRENYIRIGAAAVRMSNPIPRSAACAEPT
jgi:hypothetical protein